MRLNEAQHLERFKFRGTGELNQDDVPSPSNSIWIIL
jgi:hypothetical protein